ncbi:MAG TPA: SCO family protein [Streptosporangiaceae bacterium]|nr:SCO family protein [Streptosporangiaceae bacterium]
MTRLRLRAAGRPWRALAVGAVLAGLLAVTACEGSHLAAGTPGSAGGGPAGGGPAGGGPARAAADNPDLDPGTTLHGHPAPGFRLVNQFGQPMSLAQFRGKVVILAFTDSECTTICPLTTASMVQARQLLGPAGDKVALLGIDANPKATAVADAMAYSRAHGMVNQWDFLTGSLPQLRAVWRAYHVYVQIEAGQIDHTPALFVIDQRGREQEVYLTSMAYASVGQEAQVLAQETARLLPGHPKLASLHSLAYIKGLGPTSRATLPGVPAGSITLGPGRPQLVMFFATWLAETSPLAARLAELNRYARAARRAHLPPLTAVDEAVTEPSPAAIRNYLTQQRLTLRYPVALDTTGRLADGYGVLDQPWFVLTSATGKIIWKHHGWLPVSALEAAARKA